MSEGFFDFRSLVSTSIIKVLYLMGAIILTLLSIVQIVVSLIILNGHTVIDLFQPFAAGDQGLRIFISILVLTLGNLFWRLLCEGWILLFSMHEILSSIERELKRRNEKT
jgi:hypothetical protein